MPLLYVHIEEACGFLQSVTQPIDDGTRAGEAGLAMLYAAENEIEVAIVNSSLREK